MSMKEKMMDAMMDKMSKEEKADMMEKMMDKFFSDFTAEEKQNMMMKMMPRMMGEGMPMMGMMAQMMNCGDGEFNPMDMCKKMMQSMTRSSEMAEFATPELRGLFEDWLQQIEEEVLQFVNQHDTAETRDIAAHFKLSEDSVITILGKLAQKGKLKFKPEKK